MANRVIEMKTELAEPPTPVDYAMLDEKSLAYGLQHLCQLLVPERSYRIWYTSAIVDITLEEQHRGITCIHILSLHVEC